MIIGVTGGIGSGKTTFSKALAEKGAYLIDADEIVHRLYKVDKKLKHKISEIFGKNVIINDQIDRQQLSNIVTSDRNELEKLNRIVHERVEEEIKNEVNEKSSKKVIVLDVPIPTKTGFIDICDFIIVIKSSKQERINRIIKRNDISGYEAVKRLKMQISQKEYDEIADNIVLNNGTKEELKEKAIQIYEELIQ